MNPVDCPTSISTDASGDEGVIGLVGLDWEENKVGMDRVRPCVLDGGQSLGDPAED